MGVVHILKVATIAEHTCTADAMSKSSQSELTSFFQVGGIHGLPYVAWDSAGESDPAEDAGYCTHGSVLFPTWHRPYVALYEVWSFCLLI